MNNLEHGKDTTNDGRAETVSEKKPEKDLTVTSPGASDKQAVDDKKLQKQTVDNEDDDNNSSDEDAKGDSVDEDKEENQYSRGGVDGDNVTVGIP